MRGKSEAENSKTAFIGFAFSVIPSVSEGAVCGGCHDSAAAYHPSAQLPRGACPERAQSV